MVIAIGAAGWSGFRSGLGPAVVDLTHAFLFAGAPYLATVIAILRWTEDRPDAVLQTTFRLCPIVLTAAVALHFWLNDAFGGAPLKAGPDGDIGVGSSTFSAFFLGYLFVACVEALYGVLRGTGVIAAESARPGV